MKTRFIFGLIAIVAASVLIFNFILTHQKSGHVVLLNGTLVDTSQVSAGVLENEIRSGLPLGSSLAAVEDFLRGHKIEFNFDRPSSTIYAVVRDIKGGSLITRTDLGMQFHFDEDQMLKTIDAQLNYTGP